MIKQLFISVVVVVFLSCGRKPDAYMISSPDRQISVMFRVAGDSTARYWIVSKGSVIIREGQMGLIRDDGDFSKSMVLESVSGIRTVAFDYTMPHGKKRHCYYAGVQRSFHLRNAKGQKMDIIFRVSNDGAAFRYVFPETSNEVRKICREVSQFRFPSDTRAFVSPMSAAKSGWNRVNPCYEEHYVYGVPVGSLRYHEPGWVFPALFRSEEFWILISETAPDRDYCGCRLQQNISTRIFYVDFPQKSETIFTGPVYPESTLPWKTPWRIIAVGRGLDSIVESTLGTDLSKPCSLDSTDFVRPGRASWSWVMMKDDSTIYRVQKRFIDYAADMDWEYCLIDCYWNTQIGYEKIQELAEYAASKGVGILIWYNSAGDWNTTPLLPRNKLLTHEDRIHEFTRLRKMGIKGIKVDFFGGDGQSVMAYYQDILEDAARFDLMVNCHGATLPRGWQRTYPNLMTMEAVRGFEYVTFEQINADLEPSHACMQPFTRNVFDPMDFTPVCFSEVPNINRITSNGFELACSVIFWSGIQHFAETPQGMSGVPDDIKQFMREVPAAWDDIRFIKGYPGKLVVLARRSGDCWYIAGINGENIEKSLNLDMDFLQKKTEGIIITDGAGLRSFKSGKIRVEPQKPLEIKLMAHGGFVIRL
ncbi:glycoside hydrolase family 97 catalytic domain-containing protein [bacterium]|nr:glycoside hydrolase family 97 catalytic domain-containing protein [bacterium]